MASTITQAIKQICEEKNLSYESVLETVESALAAAYRKDFGNKLQNIKVQFDPENGNIRVFDVKEVVEDIDLEEEERRAEERKKQEQEKTEEGEKSKGKRKKEDDKGEEKKSDKKEKEEDQAPDEEEGIRFNAKTQIMISDAKDIKKGAKLGEEISVELEVPGEFGRMAAQTAKQVITQKLREAERQTIFDEFKNKEGEILNAVVQRREGKIVLIDVGNATGIIKPEDQVEGEYYRPGERIKVYVLSVEMTTKGPAIFLSRAHPEVVKRMFELEIPEIAAGAVEIKGISREAGARSKLAVFTSQENVDPIGSCIGQRGTRIQTIIAELGGEKIDIIEWNEDPEIFIMNALSPAKVIKVELDEKGRTALASVAPDQLSLAIGRGGQNVRLAAKLTGWKINVAEEETGKVMADSEQGELAKKEEHKEAEKVGDTDEEKAAAKGGKKPKKEDKKKKKATAREVEKQTEEAAAQDEKKPDKKEKTAKKKKLKKEDKEKKEKSKKESQEDKEKKEK